MAENPTVASSPQPRTVASTARLILAAFLLTFISARVLVFLIMSRRVPDLYAHIGQTHVHHLNYGIFLLAFVGAYLLFRRPAGGEFAFASVLYGIGMGLTFDEFGMWLHLGGPYWQRASFDAIVVIAGLFGLIGFAPALKQFRPRHWATAAVMLVGLIVFAWLLMDSFNHAAKRYGPELKQIEADSPE